MDNLLISVGCDMASDAWGFVGTVSVGSTEAFRTLEAFPTRREALTAAETLMAEVLGEMLAGREWRRIRDEHGHTPTREDFGFSALKASRERLAGVLAEDRTDDLPRDKG